MNTKGILFDVQVVTIKDKETKQATSSLCKLLIAYPCESTDTHVGYLFEDLYCNSKYFIEICKYINKSVDIEVEFKQKFNSRDYKKKLVKIGDIVV